TIVQSFSPTIQAVLNSSFLLLSLQKRQQNGQTVRTTQYSTLKSQVLHILSIQTRTRLSTQLVVLRSSRLVRQRLQRNNEHPRIARRSLIGGIHAIRGFCFVL